MYRVTANLFNSSVTQLNAVKHAQKSYRVFLYAIFNVLNLLNWHFGNGIWMRFELTEILEVIFEHLSCQYLRYLALTLIATVTKSILSRMERKLFTKQSHPWPLKSHTNGSRTLGSILRACWGLKNHNQGLLLTQWTLLRVSGMNCLEIVGRN